ncbi:MAG: M36 family metallopeptidase [Verrucomicrobiota bacterium]
MKTIFGTAIRFTLMGLLCLIARQTPAILPPTHEELPNLDRRSTGGTTEVKGEAVAALATLKTQTPEVRVVANERPHAKWIRDARGFLTGPDGQGRSVAAQTVATFATNVAHLPTKAFVREHATLFGFGPEALEQARVKREFVTPHNGLTTVVWEQELEGISIYEAVFTSHTTKRGELVSVASQFVPTPALHAGDKARSLVATRQIPTVTAAQAIGLAVRNLGETLQDENVKPIDETTFTAEQKQRFTAPPLAEPAETRLIWLPLTEDTLRLCWDVQLTSRARGEMYRLLVDVDDGEVLIRHRLTEYISDASYRVYLSDSPAPFSPSCSTPCTTQPPELASVLLTLSAVDTNASPSGWIDDGGNETRGNNVDAHTDQDANNSPDLPRPQGSPFRTFDFTANLTQAPSTYPNAAVTDLFYWCNWMHDKLYALGFTEAAGNFQNDNFGRGGLGNDALQADAQDGSGTDNANMSTPSDGSAPRMQMYVFTGSTPDRDGDFDHEIVLHEYTHGLSNRRVGGGVGLSALQSRGMGEGWSDWYGLTLLSEAGDDVHGVYAAGAYATYQFGGLTQNYYYGIRRYPYCTDLTKNPLTFRDIDPVQASAHAGVPRSPIIGSTADEVHNQGEVWCATLWEARANLITKYGHAVGNQMILQLVTDGMNLSPANPNFLQARDAILQADVVNHGGANLPELWSAFAKRGMGFSATSPASSTTVGLVEAFDVPDDLSILPTLAAMAAGPVGGPFSPNPVSFGLTNTGNASLSWSLSYTSAWLSVTPTSGVLMPGGPANTVLATIGAAANSLPLGTHTVTLWFSNQNTSFVQARTVSLNVVGRTMSDDFDPSLDASQWSAFGGTVGSTVIANNNGGAVSAPNSLWFGDSGNRFARTIPIDTTGGGGLGFSIRLANGSSSPWEMADALPDEGVVLEASTNAGVSWVILGSYDTTAYYNWTAVTSAIPVNARGPATMFQWRQKSHSGSGYDHWAIDSVSIDATPATILRLTIPSLATEGDGTVGGLVTALPAPTTNLTVLLTSSDPTEMTTPATVTVLAGQTNAAFNLTIVNDMELDGGQAVSLHATASGYASADAAITVLDNETATLSVSAPASLTEGSGTMLVGSVSVSPTPTANIQVSLSASDPTELLVSPYATIAAGQTSAGFTVTVVDDKQIDGPQPVTITASVTNWTTGFTNVIVQDNEPTNLVVLLPASAREGNGVLAGAGQVRIAGTLTTNLPVSLSSLDATELVVPSVVTILAGQTNALFNLTIVDDTDIDSAQIVTVVASAAGFSTGSTNLMITDDESPLEPFSPAPPHLATNVIQTVDLAWQSGAVLGETITNDVYFGTTPTPGAAELIGSTTSTTWALPLLMPQTTYYWRIVARKAGVTPGPVWQFTTRGVDHFTWDAVSSPQYVNEPIAMKLTAKDAFETTVSNFIGSVNFTSSSSGGTATNTLLTTQTPDYSGTGNYTLGYAFTPATNLTVTHVRSVAGVKVSIWSNAGTLLASQNVSGTQGIWTETPLVTPLVLLAGNTYRVSFYVNGGTYYYSTSRPTTFPYGSIVNGYYYANGDTFPDTFYNSDTSIFLCDLRYTVNAALAVPIQPVSSGPFSNGAWVGAVTVAAPTTNLVLRADDGSGHVGVSNPFAVELRNDLAVGVQESPDPVSLGGNVTYAISVTNIGPLAATGVVVTNALSPGVSFVSATVSQGSVQVFGKTVVCNLLNMGGNTAATLSIVATATNLGTLTNLTTVTRLEADAYSLNNSNRTLTSVQVPVIRINDVTLFEGNAGTANAVFTVSVTPAPAAAVTVNFATANGSAISPTDFIATNGVLSFAIGETNQSFVVRTVGDAAYELEESFTVNLSGAVNATLADSQGIGTIRNDDAMPTISIGDVILVEGNSGTTNAAFAVTLSAASGLATTVNYYTENGNAISGSDYTGLSGSLTIPAGVVSSNIVISVSGDLQIEGDEVFYLDLSGAGNATLLKREGFGFIMNDDGLPGDVDRFVWSPIASPQYVNHPFEVTLTALDAFNNPAVNFNGPAFLSAATGEGGTNILGTDTVTYSFPFYTGYATERTQVIYPAGELGGAGRIVALALDVASLPGIELNSWTIRIKHTTLTNYSSYLWESTDWTTVQQTNLNLTTTGWAVFYLATPFDYDGTNSLMLDFSFNNSITYGSGAVRCSARSAARTLYYYTSSFGNPLTWTGSSPSPYATSYTPNLQLIRAPGQIIPLSSVLTGVFTNGVWSGSLTALEVATNVLLRASDANGHVGSSGAFAVGWYDDVGLAVTDSSDPVAVGANLTYMIAVTNSGPSAAAGIVVSNTLPFGATLLSATASQGSVSTNGQLVVGNLGSIAAGAQASMNIIVTPVAIGVLTNIATVSRSGPDNYAGNNVATNTTLVVMPVLSINDTSVTEYAGGDTNLEFTVSLSVASAQVVTVNFATVNGTASAGADYASTNGTLNFAPGQTNQSVFVRVLDDGLAEPNETFSLVLSAPVNAELGKSNGVGIIFDNEGPPEFKITALLTNNSKVVDHDVLTGDDRGGIAISTSQAFVTGDSGTARFAAAGLTGGVSVGLVRDSLCTDLRTETVYLLGNGSTPLTSAGGTVTTLIELNPSTGTPSGVVVTLSQSFTLSSGSSGTGIFSGYGRIVIHNGTTVYDIYLPTGTVTARGAMTRPAWYSSESWAIWGVTEYFEGTLYLTYRESGTQRIVRARVPDGAVTAVATFTSLSDMASFVVSPSRNRWYFHYEGSGQFGGSSETLGYADAQFSFISSNPPVIASQPVSQLVALDGTAMFGVTATGSTPLVYQWRKGGTNLVDGGRISGARTNQLTILNVTTNDMGLYSVAVSNLWGATVSSNATLTVDIPLPPAAPFDPVPTNFASRVSVHTQLAWNDSSNSVTTSASAPVWLVVGPTSSVIAAAATTVGATVLSGSNFTSAVFSGVDLLIFRSASSGYFSPDAATRTKVSDFVAAGGGLYVELGGGYPSLDYSWVPTPGVVSTAGNTPYSDSIGIADATHPIATGVTDASLDNWSYSSHGDFTSNGGLSVVFVNDSTTRPVLLAGSFGSGRVVYSNLDPSVGHGTGSYASELQVFSNACAFATTGIAGGVWFNVYFGTNAAALPLLASNLTQSTCSPGLLAFDTTYYWQVVATNLIGSVTGAVWQFTTALDEVHFASASSSLAESGGAATITVTRENSAHSLSVQYATANGTATAGVDYTAVAGTLQFPVGVLSTNFQVPIINDAVGEGGETVLLSLSLTVSNVLLTAPSNAVLTIVDDDAVTVSLFADPTYVDTGSSTSGEVTNLTAALFAKGCQVQSFTGITPATFSNALLSAKLLVIPELEIGDLAPALSVAAKGIISNFVSGGGNLIICGQSGSRDENFVNQVFGYGVSTAASSSSSLRSGAAVGTAFDGGPATLPENSGTYEWLRSSLPAGSLSIYQDSGALYTTVAMIPRGSGKIVFLAYDWFDAVPRGTQDGGWDEVLRRALLEVLSINASNPPVIVTQPQSLTVTVGGSATFNVLAGGGTPLRYQWQKGNAIITGATNSSYTLSAVQYSNAGNYSVVISNAYGFTNSAAAALTVLPYSSNVSFYAFDTGWYDASGRHDAANENYICGDASDSTDAPYRNWFAFNVPALPGPVVAAQLRIKTYSIVTATGSETFQLHHVSTAVPTLVAGGTGLVSIFNDLADGVVYGSRSFSTSEADQFITMNLNAAFITNLVQAAGQPFAIGGAITSLDTTPFNDEAILGGRSA